MFSEKKNAEENREKPKPESETASVKFGIILKQFRNRSFEENTDRA